MPKILALVAVDVIDKDGSTIAAKPGQVHDIDARQAKALIRAGHADDNPIAVAWHSKDLDTYHRLIAEQEAADGKPDTAGNGGGTGTAAPAAPQ